MTIKTAYSTKTSPADVVSDLKNQLDLAGGTKMLLFFASSLFNPENLSQEMQKAFDTSVIFGCTTAGEIVSGKMLENSVVAMAFDSNIIEDVKVEVLEDLNDPHCVEKAFKGFEEYYKAPMQAMDFEKYVGITLIDGLSLAEEKVIDRIGDLTNVLFVGGSTGDDLKFSLTHVFANGKAYSKAAVLALLKPKVPFEILKTQSFNVLEQTLVATKVDQASRTVYEFNNQPAAEAYAQAVGAASPEENSKYFMHNPVGLIAGNEPFVRSPQQIKDKQMVFYCNVSEGMELSLLESTDIVEDTRKVIEQAKAANPKISGMINFHCILRTLELKEKGQMADYGKIFTDIPTIGFSTYGEQYLGHINQTSTILVFK